MTLITGIFKDSGGVAIASGVLRVKLDAPLVDVNTVPDTYLLQIEHDFPITSGAIGTVNLKESETAQVSYTFTILQVFTDYVYYKTNGDYYSTNDELPSHLYTDGNYYSGVTHTTDSVLLQQVAKTRLETAGESFQAIVPNVASIDFAQLERTGFATDRGPQTAHQVGDYLRSDPSFLQSLINILVSQGTWDATILYRRGNLVLVGGSTYQCIATTSINEPPVANPTKWQIFASKGSAGGTGGDDSAFGAGWSGDLNAPTKNTIYQEFTNNRATLAQVNAKAPSVDPNFTGVATYLTQSLGAGASASSTKTRLATCEYAYNEAVEQWRKRLISLIFLASSASPPQYCVAANGQTLSRTTYAELWAIANGTTGYGTGDGSTTFTVPNLASPGTGLYYVVWAGV